MNTEEVPNEPEKAYMPSVTGRFPRVVASAPPQRIEKPAVSPSVTVEQLREKLLNHSARLDMIESGPSREAQSYMIHVLGEVLRTNLSSFDLSRSLCRIVFDCEPETETITQWMSIIRDHPTAEVIGMMRKAR